MTRIIKYARQLLESKANNTFNQNPFNNSEDKTYRRRTDRTYPTCAHFGQRAHSKCDCYISFLQAEGSSNVSVSSTKFISCGGYTMAVDTPITGWHQGTRQTHLSTRGGWCIMRKLRASGLLYFMFYIKLWDWRCLKATVEERTSTYERWNNKVSLLEKTA
jgi:hypothetical protein